MKILILNSLGEIGGAERVLINNVKKIKERYPQWSIQVIIGQQGQLYGYLTELNIDAKVVPFPKPLATAGDWQGRFIQWVNVRLLIAIVQYCHLLKKMIASYHPDLIYTNGLKMDFFGLWSSKGIPVIAHIHDFISPRQIIRHLFRFYGNRFERLIAISQAVANDLKKVVSSPNKIEVVYNSIDINEFSPQGTKITLSEQASSQTDRINIGLVATFAKWKGHDVFLKSISMLPKEKKVMAYIVGGPIYETSNSQWSIQELQSMCKELNIEDKVRFTGMAMNVAEILRSLDIVVHASTQPEPFGLTIIEAMACGKPVIASNQGGPAEIIDHHQNGLLFEQNNATDLTNQLLAFINDQHLREQLGQKARQTVEQRFDLNKTPSILPFLEAIDARCQR